MHVYLYTEREGHQAGYVKAKRGNHFASHKKRKKGYQDQRIQTPPLLFCVKITRPNMPWPYHGKSARYNAEDICFSKILNSARGGINIKPPCAAPRAFQHSIPFFPPSFLSPVPDSFHFSWSLFFFNFLMP